MQITIEQGKKLLSGNSTFSQLGFSMMVTRLKNVYQNDPSPATLQKCTGEINAFLEKFKAIMQRDYAIISKF